MAASLKHAVALWLAMGTLALCGITHAAQRLVIELQPAVEQYAASKLLRRLIRMELADVEVPTPYSQTPATHAYNALYVRVLADGAGILVQLWDRGRLEGQRRVSMHGERPLLPRRIAFAAAELARRLTVRRREWARAQRQRERQERLQRRRLGAPIHAQWSVAAQVHWERPWGNDAWLVGPQLSGRLTFAPGLIVGLAAGFVHGEAFSDGARQGVDRPASWMRLNLVLGKELYFDGEFSFALGAEASAGVLRAPRAVQVDERANKGTWLARAGGWAEGGYRFAAGYALTLTPSVGLNLRRFSVEHGAVERTGVLAFGAALGLLYSPRFD